MKTVNIIATALLVNALAAASGWAQSRPPDGAAMPAPSATPGNAAPATLPKPGSTTPSRPGELRAPPRNPSAAQPGKAGPAPAQKTPPPQGEPRPAKEKRPSERLGGEGGTDSRGAPRSQGGMPGSGASAGSGGGADTR